MLGCTMHGFSFVFAKNFSSLSFRHGKRERDRFAENARCRAVRLELKRKPVSSALSLSPSSRSLPSCLARNYLVVEERKAGFLTGMPKGRALGAQIQPGQ